MVCEYLKTFLWRFRSGNEVNSRKGSSLKIDGNHFVHLPYLVFVFVTGSHYAAQGALDLLSTSDMLLWPLHRCERIGEYVCARCHSLS